MYPAQVPTAESFVHSLQTHVSASVQPCMHWHHIGMRNLIGNKGTMAREDSPVLSDRRRVGGCDIGGGVCVGVYLRACVFVCVHSFVSSSVRA